MMIYKICSFGRDYKQLVAMPEEVLQQKYSHLIW